MDFSFEKIILKERSNVARYFVAFLLSVVFLFASGYFYSHHVRIPFSTTFSINLTASVLSTIYGGLGPGMLSTLISALSSGFFIPSPPTGGEAHTLESIHKLNIIFTSTIVNLLVSFLRTSYQKAHQAMQEAEKSKMLMKDVIAVVSHDLKAPLTAIGLKADLLLREQSVTNNQGRTTQKHIEDLKRVAASMTTLINHLLDFEKIKSGRLLSNHLQVENVNELLREVLTAMEPLASQKRISLNTSIEEPFIAVKCDRVRMTQVFSNLLENAIKFSPPNSSVFVETTIFGDALRCLVSDSGSGIEERDIPRVFDRFWQSKQTSYQGVGLGLSIVKGILEAHGGEISVRSQLDVGTTFVFTLPIAHEKVMLQALKGTHA